MRIAIVYGGKSAEHNISVRSVTNVFNQIKSLSFQPILIAFDPSGKGYLQDYDIAELNSNSIISDKPIHFSPGRGIVDVNGNSLEIDCVIPLIHGTYGEDGCLQGALEISQVPYIGENVATSAICMDKHLTKIILQQSGINITPFLVFFKRDKNPVYQFCSERLGSNLVVKPAASGSSFGVTLTNSETAFYGAVQTARKFSDKILIEKYIEGREINCALFGSSAVAGNLGEIINIKSPVYSYEEKYIVKSNKLQIPADLSKSMTDKIKSFGLKCFRALDCKSMARIDVFLDRNGELYMNEINTIPALSENSIYPKLLESAGVSQQSLFLSLINQAIKKESFHEQ